MTNNLWTTDTILSTYRFCNVRREDDHVTVWIRENIKTRFVGHPYLWLMLCIARQINWPDTLAELIETKAWPFDDTFQPASITNILNARKVRGDKVYTGAYMISAPQQKGADKQAYIAETVIGSLWRRRASFTCWNNCTIKGTHSRLMMSDGWGHFMAYQAVVDMRFTFGLLDIAEDIHTWAAAGPGTIRGLNRLYSRALDYSLSQAQALKEMIAIYEVVQEAL